MSNKKRYKLLIFRFCFVLVAIITLALLLYESIQLTINEKKSNNIFLFNDYFNYLLIFVLVTVFLTNLSEINSYEDNVI